MQILITGADTPLGALAASHLRADHALRLTGEQPHPPHGLEGLPYTAADLREPGQVAPLLDGVEAIAHLAPYQPRPTPEATAEKEALDRAARGTYVLLQETVKAGAGRFVLASRLELMAAYPEQYVVDETWKPLPEGDAASLAPYLAELTVREFVRAEALAAVCLRLGPVGGEPHGTTPEDAAKAVERALTVDLEGRKYRWWLYHVASTERYPLGAAAGAPFNFTRAPEGA